MNEDRYVVVHTVNGETWATSPRDKQTALSGFHVVTTMSSTYAPDTGNRVRVMAEAEWQRIQAGAR